MAVATKSTVRIIVLRKRSLSTPRLVEYTLLEPPNAAPSPVPFCCSKIAVMSSTEMTI